MAQLDGRLLFQPGGPLTSGGIFLLNGKSPESAEKVLAGRWTVEVRAGSRYVLARRDMPLAGYEDARNEAFRAAQQGLDFLAIFRVADLSIKDARDEHLAWWADPAGIVLRHTFTLPFSVTISSRARDRGADGAAQIRLQASRGVWHESLRYFRLAQVTDDLFDAFRNLYLALESILAQIAPQKRNPPEPEGVWLRRALGEVKNRIDLTPFVPRGTPDPSQRSHQAGSEGISLPA